MKNRLYIITGPAGVGKSTISLQLANNLEKSVLIEGDVIYNFFVGGRIKPWYKDAPLDLFWKNVKYLRRVCGGLLKHFDLKRDCICYVKSSIAIHIFFECFYARRRTFLSFSIILHTSSKSYLLSFV